MAKELIRFSQHNVFDKEFFKRRNKGLELAAVRFSKIEPHHNVLEVGFGPGEGLKAAYEIIKDDKGKVFGVEISDAMFKEAARYLKNEICTGKVEIQVGDVMKLPFQNDMFDRVFHCNCYYFWNDMRKASDELYRVMGKNSRMLTVMNFKGLEQIKSLGYMKYGNTDPDHYMDNLKLSGFENVCLNHLTSKSGVKFQIISAEIHEK